MSTHRQELLELQDKARRAGRTVTFFRETSDGPIDQVFYIDPKAPKNARSHTGILLNPLTFAEIEREKPAWYKMPESFAAPKAVAAGRFHAPRGYTPGTTYSLGDMPTTAETGVPFRDLYKGAYRAVPTGEKRAPKAGEWYLSGADVQAYKMRGDGVQSEYLIAKLVRVERVQAAETYRIIG